MDGNKNLIRFRQWIRDMGFRLPSGSTLPFDDFAALMATPNRRFLWLLIVNSVDDRRKVECKRKEILAHNLKVGGKNASKEEGDRLSLWKEQQRLEEKMKCSRDKVSDKENGILMKCFDLISETCKLAELEKQCEEYKEKLLILKLHKQRLEKKAKELEIIMESFHSGFLDNVDETLCSLKEQVEQTVNEYNNTNHEKDTKGKEKNPWEEVINWKMMYQKQFENFLEEVKSNEKGLLSKKKSQIESNLNSSLGELKQKMTEKALQVMVNTKEGKGLNLKIQEVMNKLEETCQRDESFNESFFTSVREKENHLEVFTNHAKVLALKSYKDFLEDELMKLEKKEKQTVQDGREKFEKRMKDMEAISDEIHALRIKNQEQTKDIMTRYEELEVLLNKIREDKEETYKETFEETVTSLKSSLGKDTDIFLKTPFDAFRKVETPSGRVVFECESLDHCLDNYGGELRDFFTGMLIAPTKNVTRILTELEKRKKSVAEAKEFISKWRKLVECQKKSQNSVDSVKTDSKIWERNLEEAKAALWQTSNKMQKIKTENELLRKILKNWVEQPYRFMVENIKTELTNI